MIAAVLLSLMLVPMLQGSNVPQRVFDTRQKTFSDFETMLADLARADAVFVGEQHNDLNTHRLELAIIEGLTRRGVSVVVAMEMFERDVQPTVDQYAAGTISEAAFLAASRPWPPVCERLSAHHRVRKGEPPADHRVQRAAPDRVRRVEDRDGGRGGLGERSPPGRA